MSSDRTVLIANPPPVDKYVIPTKGISEKAANICLSLIEAYLDLKLTIIQQEVTRQLKVNYQLSSTHNKG
jgi:hypothetical protein